MARVSKKDTNLPYDLWIDGEGSERQSKHKSPRLKVKVDNNLNVKNSVIRNGSILLLI